MSDLPADTVAVRTFRWIVILLTVVLVLGLLWYGITTGIMDTDNRDGYPASSALIDGLIAGGSMGE